jgi:ankyrin repeat protein
MAMAIENYYEDYSSEGEYGEEEFTPDSVLLSMVQSYDWNGTLARIKAFPEECKAVGIQGRAPLHVSCDHDAPALVIQALMKAYPEAALQVGTSNMNPLHITCSSQHASAEVVRVLLVESSGLSKQMSSMCDVDGDTPLHAACRCGAPIEVLQLLLQANSAAVNERDYEGLTPLLRLWVRYFVILGDDVIAGVKGPADLTGELGEAWKKTELLLYCAYVGSLKPGPSAKAFRPMHAASAIDCPRPVVKIATIVYKDQLLLRDENGLTPLLIASKTPIYKVRDLSDDGYMLEDRIHGDDTDDEMAYEEDIDTSQSSVIDLLMEAAPSAACIADPSGRLALHLAINTGKRWHQGVKAILDGHPDALSKDDVASCLIPFMQASIVQRPDTGTIFELLRRDPALAMHSTSNYSSSMDEDGDESMQRQQFL